MAPRPAGVFAIAWPLIVPTPAVSEVAKTIQLAVAPVFVLAGIATLLNVFTGRLARVIDRVRDLEERQLPDGGRNRDAILDELAVLDRRMGIVNAAIFLSTAAACVICLLVALLFVSDVASLRTGRAVAGLFVFAMGLLAAGLTTFLVEVRVAMKAVRISPELVQALRERG